MPESKECKYYLDVLPGSGKPFICSMRSFARILSSVAATAHFDSKSRRIVLRCSRRLDELSTHWTSRLSSRPKPVRSETGSWLRPSSSSAGRRLWMQRLLLPTCMSHFYIHCASTFWRSFSRFLAALPCLHLCKALC